MLNFQGVYLKGNFYWRDPFFTSLGWKLEPKVVSLMDDGGGSSCEWIMKVPVSSYVNVPTLQARLGCFNATEMFFLGVPTVAYSAGEDLCFL